MRIEKTREWKNEVKELKVIFDDFGIKWEEIEVIMCVSDTLEKSIANLNVMRRRKINECLENY